VGGELLPLDLEPRAEGYLATVHRMPLGLIAGISPFNFPLNLVAHKVAPALAAGNALVLKPASKTPLSALRLGHLALEAGAPPGALNVVSADRETGERIVADPRFRMLTFTGSAAVGWPMKARAGAKKKVVLELGGNAAAIVEPDADLDWAADRCASGGFFYAGQSCISVQRILVHAHVYEDFRAAIPVVDHVEPDEALLAQVRAWLPEALVVPIGTSASVGGTTKCDVEAMEGFGVLRACTLAGVPAVELRVIANSPDEPDRLKWRFDDAFAALAAAVERVLSSAS